MYRLIILILLIFSTGCGGGTTGSASTGGFVEKTFTGELKDINGKPLVNAKVEILATGDSTVTDKNGKFNLVSTVPVGTVVTQITTTDGKKILIETYADEVPGSVPISITYVQEVVQNYKDWQFSLSVTGPDCSEAFYGYDLGFYTKDRLEQITEGMGYDSNSMEQFFEIKEGASCNIKINIFKNGKPVPNMDYNANIFRCSYDRSMEVPSINSSPYASGKSDENGEINIPFTYQKTGICRFEIMVPKYGGLRLGAALDVSTSYGTEILKYF